MRTSIHHYLLTILFAISVDSTYAFDATILVNNQQSFDNIDAAIRESVLDGKKDIIVKIRRGSYTFHDNHITLKGLSPDVSVIIKGDNVNLYPVTKFVGIAEPTKSTNIYYRGKECAVTDNWTEVKQCNQAIEVVDSIEKLCRLRLNDGDIAAKGDVIMISQWYYTRKYEITKKNGVYVSFVVDNLKRYGNGINGWNINSDYVYGQEMPRYRIWHTTNTKPDTYEGRAMTLVNMINVKISKFVIEGISFCGNSYHRAGALIQMNGVKSESLVIKKCTFRNCHTTCISLDNTINMTVNGCRFYDNLTTVIYSGGGCENVQIINNLFANNSCGWNNTFCINIKGKDFRIDRNVFRDFGYGAIGIGEHIGDIKVCVTGIIEKNEIYYSPEYYSCYKKHTLMDSGAIYLWTQNDNVIIRNNYIHDYIGAKDNRGIFCDDGAANFKIIGNRILRIANSYCIDSRRIKDQHPEKFTNNVNISITDNTVDGSIRFEGSDDVGNKCVYGNNTIIMVDGGEPPVMKISNVKIVKKDIMSRR